MQDGWTLADGESLPSPRMLAFDDGDDEEEGWDEDEDLDEVGISMRIWMTRMTSGMSGRKSLRMMMTIPSGGDPARRSGTELS